MRQSVLRALFQILIIGATSYEVVPVGQVCNTLYCQIQVPAFEVGFYRAGNNQIFVGHTPGIFANLHETVLVVAALSALLDFMAGLHKSKRL